MKKVYCICGLGADERIFSKLTWQPGTDVHYIQWLVPEKDETLEAYAKRMAAQITSTDDFTLIGVSFGGIMAIEITRIMPVKKLILISSVETHHQLPTWMKLCGKLRLYRLIPTGVLHDIRPLKLFEPIENYFLGSYTQDQKALAREYRKNVNPYYLKWSIRQILHWKNERVFKDFYHIHGTADRIFPIKKITPTHSIEAGRHFMLYHKPEEVSEVLRKII
ncbi:alpha/beta hydrolase [Terrimonas sp.]|uniref:alpha/beta fold hydrolase n=1 Tax=Terrimonas sp. TaxID=1914338 RepID=UPI000D506D35|nr:alpha/beta hydrolase [Terrimonas sp.]PVD53495.1 alpha/beta hydrolase [Terrimonas sp.]